MANEEAKKRAALYAADFVKEGMNIGLGTGSTVYWLIQELSERIKRGLNFSVVPTSTQTELLAKQLRIPVIDLETVDELDLTIDGADEIDENLQLIKGGGGALLREKIVATASRELIIIADSSKCVKRLGNFPLPVEVIPFGFMQVQNKINKMYAIKSELRIKGKEKFVTNNRNYILDCYFESIEDPSTLNSQLNLIPGVVETGLFVDMATTVIISDSYGEIKLIKKKKTRC